MSLASCAREPIDKVLADLKEPESQRIPVVYARNKIEAGQSGTAADFRVLKVPAARVPLDGLHVPEEAIGKKAKDDIEPEQIVGSHDLVPLEHTAGNFYPLSEIQSCGAQYLGDEHEGDQILGTTLLAFSNSKEGRDRLRHLIKCLGNNKYEVIFPGEDKEVVDADEPIDPTTQVHSHCEKWATVLDTAFHNHFESLEQQQKVSGIPQIKISLSAFEQSDDQIVLFRPDEETPALVEKAFSTKVFRPMLVALKHKDEIKGPPMEAHPHSLAFVSYDPAKKRVILQNSEIDALNVSEAGLEQVDPYTYAVPLSLFPKYIRFVCYLQTPEKARSAKAR